MGKSKIIYNGQTLIDLTGDTVTAETLLEGITAHGADGEAILGKLKAGGSLTVLSGTARCSSGKPYYYGQLLMNCALPEANLMWLHVEPSATTADTSSISFVNYFMNDGAELAKSVWCGTTLNANASTALTIDRENGKIYSVQTQTTNQWLYYASYQRNFDYKWWYVYG